MRYTKIMKTATDSKNLTGIWKSHYRYPSTSRGGEFEGEHDVRLTQKGRWLVIESLPGQKSYLLIRLSLDDNIATGSWQEVSNPSGYYQGAIYHGAIQLVLDADGKHLRGKWIGFGKDMEVNVGPWELTYIGKAVPKTAA